MHPVPQTLTLCAHTRQRWPLVHKDSFGRCTMCCSRIKPRICGRIRSTPVPRERPPFALSKSRGFRRHYSEEVVMPSKQSSSSEVQTLLTGLAYGESPRWHEGRLWFSNWGMQEIVAVDLEGHSEVILRMPS